jgi:expansin (peptidoglycan-binding protein)
VEKLRKEEEKPMEIMKRATNRSKGTLSISAELFAVLQAEQERLRVQERLLARPTYTDILYRMWEAYQEKNSSQDATPAS